MENKKLLRHGWNNEIVFWAVTVITYILKDRNFVGENIIYPLELRAFDLLFLGLTMGFILSSPTGPFLPFTLTQKEQQHLAEQK